MHRELLSSRLIESDAEKIEKSTRACRDALFLTNPRDDRAGLISTKGKRVDGSCQWIEENPTYKAWLQSDTPLLWICGGPGKGKTMLSIYLTQQLEKKKEKDVIWFFCIDGDEKRNSATALMRSLLRQITEKQPKLSQHLFEDFERVEATGKPSLCRSTLAVIRDDLQRSRL